MIRKRAWVELLLAVLAAIVGIVTAVYPSWFEALFEASPDAGSGALEWLIAIALGLISAALSLLARENFRRPQASRRR
jgi:energy-converting hydrogenase Eha subunit A